MALIAALDNPGSSKVSECPGVRLYRHLSLKLSWAALRRIYDPSLMWRPVEILVICYLASSGVSLGLTSAVALDLTRDDLL